MADYAEILYFERKSGGLLMVIELIGWIGSAMVVLAYGLNIYKLLAADTILYFVLNLAGSACLIVNTLAHHAIPSAVVNIIWVFIALIAILKRGRPAQVRKN